jgi:hypothetical protein
MPAGKVLSGSAPKVLQPPSTQVHQQAGASCAVMNDKQEEGFPHLSGCGPGPRTRCRPAWVAPRTRLRCAPGSRSPAPRHLREQHQRGHSNFTASSSRGNGWSPSSGCDEVHTSSRVDGSAGCHSRWQWRRVAEIKCCTTRSRSSPGSSSRGHSPREMLFMKGALAGSRMSRGSPAMRRPCCFWHYPTSTEMSCMQPLALLELWSQCIAALTF